LNAPWYRNPANLSSQIDRYVDKLIRFDNMDWGDTVIERDEITGRVLEIIVPKNSGTSAQRDAIAGSAERAQRLRIFIFLSYY
jgi:hypothetical protein